MEIASHSPIRPSTSDLWFLAYLPLSISDGIAAPLIPLLALQKFGASAFVVTIIIAASALSQVPFTIIWGNLSDRVSHRKFFLVGSFFATGVSLVLIALSQNLLTYFWFNVVEGLASAASAPIGTMLLLETRHKRWWPQDIGLFELIAGIGTTVGLGLGFLWLFVFAPSSQAIPFMVRVMTNLLLFAGLLALASAFIAWLWIEEPLARLDRRVVSELISLHRGILERFRHVRSRFLSVVELTRSRAEPMPWRETLFLVSLWIMTVGFNVFYGPFPVFLVNHAHFSDASVFIAYLASSAASTMLFFHSGKLVEVRSPKGIFLGSLAARFVLIPLFVLGPVYTIFGVGSSGLVSFLTLLNALMGVSWAFIGTASTLFLVRLVGRSGRGRALGLYNAFAGAGGLFGVLLGGFLYVTIGPTSTYFVAGGIVLLGAAVLAPIPYHMFTLPRGAMHRGRHWRAVRGVVPGSGPRMSPAPPPRASGAVTAWSGEEPPQDDPRTTRVRVRLGRYRNKPHQSERMR
jgi:MFS family permease